MVNPIAISSTPHPPGINTAPPSVLTPPPIFTGAANPSFRAGAGACASGLTLTLKPPG